VTQLKWSQCIWTLDQKYCSYVFTFLRICTSEYQQKTLHAISNIQNDDSTIITGDLNAPDINWLTLYAGSPFSHNLCNTLHHLNYLQLVNTPTPLTNSWVRIMTGDLPEPREGCRTAIIQHNDSHWWGDNQSKLNKTDLIGTITVQNSSVGVTVTSTGLLQLCTETSICTHSFLHSQALFLHCITEQKVHWSLSVA